MVGKFDPKQHMSNRGRTIVARGPIEWAPGDQDRVVTRIDVDFTENGGQSCNGHTDSHVTFEQDVDTVWAFAMNNRGMAAGTVTARAVATMDDDSERTWQAQVSIVA